MKIMSRIYFFLLIYLTSFFFDYAIECSAGDLNKTRYKIDDITVSFQKNAVSSDRLFPLAIEKGKQEAFQNFLECNFSLSEEKMQKIVHQENISYYIEKVDLKKEDHMQNSYSFTLIYYFSPPKIESFLKKYSLVFNQKEIETSQTNKTIFVLPILKLDDKVYFWEKENILKYILAEANHIKKPPLDFTFPQKEKHETIALTAQQALQGDTQKILSLAHSYKMPFVFVIFAHVHLDQTAGVIDFSTHHYGDIDHKNIYFKKKIPSIADVNQTDFKQFSFDVKPDHLSEHTFYRLQAALKEGVIFLKQTLYPQIDLSGYQLDKLYKTEYSFSNLKEITFFKEKMRKLFFVKDFNIDQMQYNKIFVNFFSFSDTHKVKKFFQENDFNFDEEKDVYRLSFITTPFNTSPIEKE